MSETKYFTLQAVHSTCQALRANKTCDRRQQTRQTAQVSKTAFSEAIQNKSKPELRSGRRFEAVRDACADFSGCGSEES